MNARFSLGLAALAIFGCLGAASPEKWVAASTTAMGITGDVTLAPDVIRMAGHRFALSHAHAYGAAQQKQASAIVALLEPVTAATMYAIAVPHGTTLLRGNTLCGSDTRWLLVVRSASSLGLAFYSGAKEPQITAASANDPTLCGTFGYARP